MGRDSLPPLLLGSHSLSSSVWWTRGQFTAGPRSNTTQRNTKTHIHSDCLESPKGRTCMLLRGETVERVGGEGEGPAV